MGLPAKGCPAGGSQGGLGGAHQAQYGRLASLGLLSCTLRRFIPIWKPFMAWMAAWALAGLSKLTKPVGTAGTSGMGTGVTTTLPCLCPTALGGLCHGAR